MITGATGFIGSQVARFFCEHGVKVGCLVRFESNLANLAGIPVQLVEGDLCDADSLVRAFQGYDLVIHLAAYAHDWGSEEEFYETNVMGTLKVLKACVANQIKDVILTASVSVYGEEDSLELKDETSPLHSHYHYFWDKIFPSQMNTYRDTKAQAKQIAISYAQETGLNLTILEPVWVYGEREFNTGFYEYLRTVQSGISFLPGSKRNKFHVIYVRDLARAYYLAFQKRLPGIQSLIIGNQQAEQMDLIYRIFCEQAGLKKPRNAPKWVFYPIGMGLELFYTLFKIKQAPLLTRARVNMFYDNIEYNTKKAQEILGFTNEYILEEGVARTVKWYQEQKLLETQSRQSNNVTGIKKEWLILRLELWVFLRFLPEFLKGRLGIRKFVMFLRRLLYFLKQMKENKFVKINGKTRIDLYCPGFPGKGFETACRKFMVFDQKLPCTTALISITSACPYHCPHCYQRYDQGKDLEMGILVRTVQELQEMGIAFFNFEGGEPFLVYDRLKQLCEALDERSEIWINSTGYGITLERLQELKELKVTSIMFSLHTPEPEKLNQFMGDDQAWERMSQAVDLCHQVGIAVSFNACLPKEDFYNGNFEQIMEVAKAWGGVLIQLIKPKAAGGWLEKGVSEFAAEDLQRLKDLVERYNHHPKYRDYPAISAQAIEESPEQFGCTSGGTDRFYINAKGDLQPCEFLNLSFGNLSTDDFKKIYQQMRETFMVPGECWLCEKYASEIFKIFKEHQLKTLPLSPELSKEIYEHWERGKPTELYKKINKLR